VLCKEVISTEKMQAQFWKFINEANDQMQDETTKLLDAWIPKEAVHLYLYYVLNWNKQTQTEFSEKKQLNLRCNFVDVVQSKRKSLADGNDNIADQESKRSTVLPAELTDPIIEKLKFPVCNSICDIETADTASVLMNDEDAIFDDEADEPPTSLVPEPPLIEECDIDLAAIA
jgi:hypothetical protein